jgi:hypothetical protein
MEFLERVKMADSIRDDRTETDAARAIADFDVTA